MRSLGFARRNAVRHAHRTLFRRQRVARSQASGTHCCLFHGEPLPVLGPGPAANRRRKLQDYRWDYDQLPPSQAGLAVDFARHYRRKHQATTRNTFFKFLGIPLFYLPYLRHPVEETGRESGLLIPVVSNSSIKGLTVGEQVYIVLNRSMDMVIGSEYYSKRGLAPNGDFRYKGKDLNLFNVKLTRCSIAGSSLPRPPDW